METRHGNRWKPSMETTNRNEGKGMETKESKQKEIISCQLITRDLFSSIHNSPVSTCFPSCVIVVSVVGFHGFHRRFPSLLLKQQGASRNPGNDLDTEIEFLWLHCKERLSGWTSPWAGAHFGRLARPSEPAGSAASGRRGK